MTAPVLAQAHDKPEPATPSLEFFDHPQVRVRTDALPASPVAPDPDFFRPPPDPVIDPDCLRRTWRLGCCGTVAPKGSNVFALKLTWSSDRRAWVHVPGACGARGEGGSPLPTPLPEGRVGPVEPEAAPHRTPNPTLPPRFAGVATNDGVLIVTLEHVHPDGTRYVDIVRRTIGKRALTGPALRALAADYGFLLPAGYA